jgi:hypothetical protein
VEDHADTVRRRLDVDLDDVCTIVQRRADRVDRVLAERDRVAAVRDGQGSRKVTGPRVDDVQSSDPSR